MIVVTLETRLNRRRFAMGASAWMASSVLLSDVTELPGQSPTPTTADQIVVGKDKRLVVHNATVGEIETPLELLREHRITPKQLLFVRNNQQLPNSLSLDASDKLDDRIEWSGLVDSIRSISVRELSQLPQLDIELVLQCSGNSRSRFESSVKAEGVSWKHGAMGNVVMRGARLSDVIRHLAIQVSSKAAYIAVEGADIPNQPDTPDFEHSIPLRDALDKSILAIAMNGEPLPRVHGGPVRLITPGFYATMNVKWVSRIRFEEHESTNHHHLGRYRTPLKPLTPGASFKSTFENSEANWNMRIKSVIFGPLEGQSLPAGMIDIHGVAWNDGESRIESMEVSLDHGQTWNRAEIQYPSSPFAWHSWKWTAKLARGPYSILARASDANGRTQPISQSAGWNPAGYAWSSVDSVRVSVI